MIETGKEINTYNETEAEAETEAETETETEAEIGTETGTERREAAGAARVRRDVADVAVCGWRIIGK